MPPRHGRPLSLLPATECSVRAPRLPRTSGFPWLGPVLPASASHARPTSAISAPYMPPSIPAVLISVNRPSPIAASGGMSLAAALFGKRAPATWRVARGVTRRGQTWLAGHVRRRLRERRHVRRRPGDRASPPRASRGRSPAPAPPCGASVLSWDARLAEEPHCARACGSIQKPYIATLRVTAYGSRRQL